MDQTAFEISDVLSGVEEIVSTSFGPLTVTFYGDRSKSPCIAYHEVGLNHRSCFHSLIAASGPQSLLLKNFCIVFIDAPGCQSPDAEVPSEAQPVTLDKLADQVHQVTTHYKLRECLGLGVGTGGNILIRCAVQHPKLFCGLVLISPSCRSVGWWEWGAGKLAASQLHYRGWKGGAWEHFARRLFSPATLQMYGGDSDLLVAFQREASSVSPVGTEHYLRAALARTDLLPLLPKLRCRVLLMYGSEGLYQQESLDLASAVDKSRFALVETPHAGVLVNEERPAELLSPMQLFLTALQLEGYGLGAALQVGE